MNEFASSLRRRLAAVVVSSLLALIGLPAHADAFADDCREQVGALGDAVVSIELLPVQVLPQMRRVSARTLTGERVTATHNTQGIVFAHTKAVWLVTSRVDLVGVQHRTQPVYCHKPRLRLAVGFEPIQISVGSEVTVGCAYDYLVEHEREHVRLYEENLPRVAETLRQELNQAFAAMREGTDAKSSLAQRNAELQALVKTVLKRQMQGLHAVHHRFDAEDTHRMNGNACARTIYDIAGKIAR